MFDLHVLNYLIITTIYNILVQDIQLLSHKSFAAQAKKNTLRNIPKNIPDILFFVLCGKTFLFNPRNDPNMAVISNGFLASQ